MRHYIGLYIFCWIMMGGLTSRPSAAFELESASDATVSDLMNSQKQEIKAGQKVDIKEKNPLWITSPGRVPVLVVPLSAGGSSVRVDSPSAEKVLQDDRSLKIDQSLSEVTMYLSEIHRALAARDIPTAKQKTIELKGKFPQVRFINFIEASLAYLSGDRAQALALVNLGLVAHPDYGPGLELKKQLEQGGGR